MVLLMLVLNGQEDDDSDNETLCGGGMESQNYVDNDEESGRIGII